MEEKDTVIEMEKKSPEIFEPKDKGFFMRKILIDIKI